MSRESRKSNQKCYILVDFEHGSVKALNFRNTSQSFYCAEFLLTFYTAPPRLSLPSPSFFKALSAAQYSL